MALTIRLSRKGKKHDPIYRLVVQDKTRHPLRKCIEVLGAYYPLEQQKPGTPKFVCDADRVQYWIGKGATCSDTASRLLVKNTVDIQGEKQSSETQA